MSEKKAFTIEERKAIFEKATWQCPEAAALMVTMAEDFASELGRQVAIAKDSRDRLYSILTPEQKARYEKAKPGIVAPGNQSLH